MHFFQVVIAGLIFLGIGVVLLVMFGAKIDPDEEEKNRGKVISFVDEKGRFHYEDEPKMKAK